MASVCAIFFWLTLFHLLGVIAQLVEFADDGLHRGQGFIRIAFLYDQLFAHFTTIQKIYLYGNDDFLPARTIKSGFDSRVKL